MKITSVKFIESTRPVYDIEIDSADHLYKMGDIITHNCCFNHSAPLTFINSDGEVSTMNIGDYVETRLDQELGNKDYVQKALPGDEFINTRHGQIIPITGVIKLQNKWKRLIKVTFTSSDEIWCTPDQKFLLLNEELIEAKDLTEGSLLYKYLEVKSVDSYESDEPVYDIEVGSEDHIFKIKLPSGHSVRVENCRLINDSDLFDFGGQVNSFGGTALSLGSHRVCTVNMRRISLECDSYEDYKERLSKRMEDAAKVLRAHKKLIRDLEARGTQPFITNGWIDINRMFSTIGILGYCEAIEDLKKRFGNEDFDYLKDLLIFINDKCKQLTIDTEDVIINCEAIPGENMAYKLAFTDNWLYGDEKVSEKIYANQFVPLWEDVTIAEKCRREGVTKYLTGGCISHISSSEKITSKQSRKLLELMMKSNLEHAAINPILSYCENEHYTLGKHAICPKCQKPIKGSLTRTVGFFVKTENMTSIKREEDVNRRHYKDLGL